jgi:hypothetical protein
LESPVNDHVVDANVVAVAAPQLVDDRPCRGMDGDNGWVGCS